MGQRCLRSCYLWVLIEIPIQPSKSRQMSLFAVLSLYSMCLAKYVCNQNDADYGCRTTSNDDFMRMSIRNIGGHTHTEFTERKFFPCLLFWSFLCKTSFHFKKVLSYFIDQNTRLKNICFFFHWHSCWSISPHLHIATVKPFEFMQILLISKTDHFSFQSLNIHLLDLNASSVCLFICYVFFLCFQESVYSKKKIMVSESTAIRRERKFLLIMNDCNKFFWRWDYEICTIWINMIAIEKKPHNTHSTVYNTCIVWRE